jgi:hypothetical protein
VNDAELAQEILAYLTENRTTGAGGKPLIVSDANLVTTLGCDIDELNRVLGSLMEEGHVHGKSRRVVSGEVQMEWDCIRLSGDPLPPPDPREFD